VVRIISIRLITALPLKLKIPESKQRKIIIGMIKSKKPFKVKLTEYKIISRDLGNQSQKNITQANTINN